MGGVNASPLSSAAAIGSAARNASVCTRIGPFAAAAIADAGYVAQAPPVPMLVATAMREAQWALFRR